MGSGLIAALTEIALKKGAFKAQVIPTSEIPTDPVFRDICKKNTCGAYGKNYGCPPGVGTVEEVLSALSSFEYILVYQLVGELDDSFDYEGMMAAGKAHGKLVSAVKEEVEKLQLPRILSLGAGGCKVCERCAAVLNEPCRFPEKRTASLESYCINVSLLAKAAGMKYVNGQNTVTYFGGVLFDLPEGEKQ